MAEAPKEVHRVSITTPKQTKGQPLHYYFINLSFNRLGLTKNLSTPALEPCGSFCRAFFFGAAAQTETQKGHRRGSRWHIEHDRDGVRWEPPARLKTGGPPPRAQSLVIMLISSTQERQSSLRRTVGLGNHRGAGLDESVPASKLGRLSGHIDIDDHASSSLKITFSGRIQFCVVP